MKLPLLALSIVAPPPVSSKFLAVFDRLRAVEAAPQRFGVRRSVSFQFNQNEINNYIQYALKASARPGVESANTKLFSNNYVSTFVVVDFDAIAHWSPGKVPALLQPGKYDTSKPLPLPFGLRELSTAERLLAGHN